MVQFIVAGKVTEVSMIDDNGIDWSQDFVGNNSHGMVKDDEGRYIVTEDEAEWWQGAIEMHKEMESLIVSYRHKYGSDLVDDVLNRSHAFDGDMETHPFFVMQALLHLDQVDTQK